MNRSLVAMLLIAAACPEVHREDWARDYGTRLCRAQQRCARVSSNVDCTRPELWAEETPFQLAEQRGLVRYDGVMGARCLELIDQLACDELLVGRVQESKECSATFVGVKLVKDDGCDMFFDLCGAGLRCAPEKIGDFCGTCRSARREGERFEVSSGDQCERGLSGRRVAGSQTIECVRRGALGAACSATSPCLESLLCSDSQNGGTCGLGGPRPDAGGDVGEACSTTPIFQNWCQNGAGCDAGTCVALSALGVACANGTDCVSRRCVDGVCTTRTKEHGACETSFDCASNLDCVDGVCDATPLLNSCR